VTSGGALEFVPREYVPTPTCDAERQRQADRRFWAAMQVALDVDTCRSILRGLPVRAGNLDGFVLRRALRGAQLPDPESYLEVSGEMLDAVAEAGPLELPAPRRGRR
jgi:hypothetical protein